MEGFIEAILNAPMATLLVVAGLAFVAIAVIGEISGKIEPGRSGRIAAGVFGLIFLGIGLAMHWGVVPGPAMPEGPTTPQATTPPPTASPTPPPPTASPTPPPPTTSPTPLATIPALVLTPELIPVTLAPTPVAHATGSLVIEQTFQADLDEGAVGSNPDADIWFEAQTATERYVTPLNGASIAVMGATSVGPDDCAESALSSQRVHVDRLEEGTYVCVRTNQGRYARFRISAPIGSSPGTLSIDYTTWE
jgi:hypothetical protein